MKRFAHTIDEYLSKTGDFEPDVRQVDALIRAHAPHLAPVLYREMSGGVGLGYGLVPYKTKSMKEPSECPLLALAAQKHYISLYACAVIDGTYIAERYADALGHVSLGKSCIRFKRFEDLNEKSLIKMIKDIDRRHATGQILFG